MKKNLIVLIHWTLCLFLFSFIHLSVASAQDADKEIKGTVFDEKDGAVLTGVTVVALPSGESTQTDAKGGFKFPKGNKEDIESLVFVYTGMQRDTVSLAGTDPASLEIFLKSDHTHLQEVNVKGRKDATHMDMLNTMGMQHMGQGELLKMACCNLSESFETNPSIDAGFTDAVTGYKQIQLLGLAGPNTAYSRENIADNRGLASVTGLTFTPGVWLEGIQLSKGIGSVVNGYEGVAGQINVEWWKAFENETPTWYLNAYQSGHGRSEANVVFNEALNDGLSTGVFLHGSQNWKKNDENKDFFLDNPLGSTFVGSNRWFLFTKSNWEFQAGIKGVYVDHWGGQKDFRKDEKTSTTSPWGYKQKIRRIEGWGKIGHAYADQPWKSLGLQLSGTYHRERNEYGLRAYQGNEKSFYANFIYQTMIDNTNNVLKLGTSYLYDAFNEHFDQKAYPFKESVPGVFTEYSYSFLEKFGAVLGLRADYHNLYGFFLTPRLHLRYAPAENTTVRASVGRAQRTVNIFSENIGYLVSNRNFIVRQSHTKGAYGLQPEIAWNMGLSFLQKFKLNYREGSLLLDYFYTNFQDQVVVDIENPLEVNFYNLNGKSFAHSFQAQLDYEPVRLWDVRLAYRYHQVKISYDEALKEKPLVGAHMAFLNTGYQTRNKWRLDYTLKWNGSKRIPSYFLNNKEVSGHRSPSFVQMNVQVSKTWERSNIEWYLGAENLTNYMQPDLILNSETPYQKGFDGSLVWGPGMGRNIYTGVRIKIK